MIIKEYGTDKKDTIILLHGGGLSWWNYREVAELLQEEFHIILPILDGHTGSDRSFSSIEDNAKEIIKYIDEKCGGSVLMIGGLSLGGQVLLEILSQRKDICRYAIVESTMAIPSKFTHAMIKPAFSSSFGLIKHRWFSKLQFKSLHMKEDLFDYYYQDTCGIKKEDMIAFLQANTAYKLKESIKDCQAKVYIYIGEKETSGIKKSAALIKKSLQEAKLTILPGLYHGEFSINYPKMYVSEVGKLIKDIEDSNQG